MFYGDSFNAIQSARSNDAAQRQASSQAALTMLMRALEQRQAQQNWQVQNQQAMQQNQAQQAYQMQQAEEAARQHAAANAYNERSYREVILPESRARLTQPSPAVSPEEAARVAQFNLKNGLPITKALVDASGPYADSFRMIQGIQDKDAEEQYRLAEAAATAGNRILRIKKNAAALDAAPREGMFRPDLGNPAWADTPYQNPPARGLEMTARVQPFDERYKPYLDPKAGYVRLDPATGQYVVALKPPASLAVHGPPPPPDAPTSAAPRSRSDLIAQRLRLMQQRKAGSAGADVVTIRVSDGRLIQFPRQAVPAVLARDPQAVVLE